jgi:hypothetical protein
MAQAADRGNARAVMFRLITDLENVKPAPATAQDVQQHVVTWEEKVFNEVGNNRPAYLEKVDRKKRQCEASLAKIKPPPPPVVVAVAVEPDRNDAKDDLEALRVAIETCRRRLRIMSVFGFKRADEEVKTRFMRLFQSATIIVNAHKARTVPPEETQKKSQALLKEVEKLNQTHEARLVEYQKLLQLDTVEDLFKLDDVPFGIFERLIDVRGPDSVKERLKRASPLIGSEYFM